MSLLSHWTSTAELNIIHHGSQVHFLDSRKAHACALCTNTDACDHHLHRTFLGNRHTWGIALIHVIVWVKECYLLYPGGGEVGIPASDEMPCGQPGQSLLGDDLRASRPSSGSTSDSLCSAYSAPVQKRE